MYALYRCVSAVPAFNWIISRLTLSIKLAAIDGMQGFALNGFVNHYSDFFARTKRGTFILLESKGDDRDNSDSQLRREFGEAWDWVEFTNGLANFRLFQVGYAVQRFSRTS